MIEDFPSPLFLTGPQIAESLGQVNVRAALTSMFSALRKGTAVQPPQSLVAFPARAGDFIAYMGVMAEEKVFGTKLSPYIVTSSSPLVTAWTVLMSMQTGLPLMLCEASLLTVERTAGTTALAVDLLARPSACRLAIIGAGPVALAHLRHALPLRQWESIRIYAPGLTSDPSTKHAIAAICPEAICDGAVADTICQADVVMLCTSSGTPVLQVSELQRTALITSISTNAVLAHEVAPASLPAMDVYCDYKRTTPAVAGEMVLAAEQHGWQEDKLVGDLPDLVEKVCPLPDYTRHVFFRSVGLGLEDVAVANAIYRHRQAIG